jgi:hypothetical protein
LTFQLVSVAAVTITGIEQARKEANGIIVHRGKSCPCMLPYSLPLGKVWFVVCVTVYDRIVMSAFNMCMKKLESLYALYLSDHMMALHWEILRNVCCLFRFFGAVILSIL